MSYKYMVLLFLLIITLFLSTNCATASYGTARFREQSMDTGSIALSPGGFSREQVDVILATQFPPGKPISIALFYLVHNYYGEAGSYDPVQAIIKKIDNNDWIQRIIPVPRILIPVPLSIDAIQQIGIRTISEYSLVFYGDAAIAFFSYKSPLGHYMISSTLEFMLIDNRTTAIIAADKLFSEFQAPVEFFTDEGYQKTKQRMYEEQAAVLYAKLSVLFSNTKRDGG